MANSSGVNHPEVSGNPVTSSTSSAGSSSAGMVHSAGIESRRAWRFSAARFSQSDMLMIRVFDAIFS